MQKKSLFDHINHRRFLTIQAITRENWFQMSQYSIQPWSEPDELPHLRRDAGATARVYKTPICDVVELRQRLDGVSSSRGCWTTPLTSSEEDSKLVFRQTVVISNSACNVVSVYRTIFPHRSTTGFFFRSSHPTTCSFQSHLLFSEENSRPINFD